MTPIGALTPARARSSKARCSSPKSPTAAAASCCAASPMAPGCSTLRFFYFSAAQQDDLARGTRLRCYGEVRRGPLGLEMVHPEYRRLSHEAAPLEETLTPIYPLTEGLTQGRLRALVGRGAARDSARAAARTCCPPSRGLPRELPSLREALDYLHRPPREAPARGARRRPPPGAAPAGLRGTAGPPAVAASCASARSRPTRPARSPTRRSSRARFLAALPFALTGAQRARSAEVEARPRQRRADGAAGAGRCRLRQDRGRRGGGGARRRQRPAGRADGAHRAAGRAALAQLHALVRPARGDRGAADRLAAGAHAAQRAARRSPRRGAASSSARMRCSRKASSSRNLALVIVDEQHRFGVQQRLRLQEKGAQHGRVPHQLIMTATPIPRTLAMTAYADLDVSVIDELPPGRTPVRTVVHAGAAPRRGGAAHRRGLPRRAPGLLGVPADRGVRGAARPGRGGNRGAR